MRTLLAPQTAAVVSVGLFALGCTPTGEIATQAPLSPIEDSSTVPEVPAPEDTAPAEPCPAGKALCGGVCTVLFDDPKNCGTCGVGCSAGQLCVGAKCRRQCPTGQIDCNGRCLSTETDRENCGGCAQPCAEGEVCSASKCAIVCATGFATCASGTSSYCANTKTERENCGACAKTCASGETCKASECVIECAAGQFLCGDGKCHNLTSDNAHCGVCARACASGQTCKSGVCTVECAMGQTLCSGTCRDLTSDNAHCGVCARACASGQTCKAGACTVECAVGQTLCSGTCHNLTSDNAHCGACGAPCSGGSACTAGVCKLSCSGSQVDCGGTCIDPSTSRTHCGATAGCGTTGGSAGTACALDQACASGTCLAPVFPVTAGLAARYTARDLSTLAFPSAGVVGGWNDLSGGGNHLGGGPSPTYVENCINGRSCLDFGGAKGLASAAFALTTEVTVFVVAQYKTPSAWGAIAHHGSQDTDWSLENHGGKELAVTHFQSNTDNTGAELSLVEGHNYILSARISGATRDYAATSTSGTVSASGAGVSIVAGPQPLYLGRSALGEGSNAQIGEFIYYNRALSDAERANVVAYLRSVWGI